MYGSGDPALLGLVVAAPSEPVQSVKSRFILVQENLDLEAETLIEVENLGDLLLLFIHPV